MADWKSHVNDNGEFELPKYIYTMINDLMKMNLDLGTLVCSDMVKLRAYKERVKSSYKQKWADIASALENFGVIQPCVCKVGDFCQICGGSRYLLDEALALGKLEWNETVVIGADADVAEKLRIGMERVEGDLQKLTENERKFWENHGKAKKEQ